MAAARSTRCSSCRTFRLASPAAAQIGLPECRARHLARSVQVHDLGPPNDRRDRQRAGEALRRGEQIRAYLVVLEPEHLARPPKSRLHLVENQQGAVAITPAPQVLDVLFWRETGPTALVALHHDAADGVRVHVLVAQRLLEQGETDILGPEAVRERDLDERRVQRANPGLEGRDAASQLSAHGAAVEGALEGHEDRLALPPDLAPVGLGQLDGVLRRLATGRQQEHPVKSFRRDLQQLLDQPGPGRVRGNSSCAADCAVLPGRSPRLQPGGCGPHSPPSTPALQSSHMLPQAS